MTAPAHRRARAAVFAVFGINGFVLAMWVVHIPAVQQRAGVSNAALGTLLLMLAVGAIGGMQTTGRLADRFGSDRTTAVAAAALAITAVGPGLATRPWQLAVALVLFGFANGALDVSMNSQAVVVEQRYRRPIMAAFHGLFSVGGVAGSLVGAATLAAAWAPAAALAVAGAVGLTVVAVASGQLIRVPRYQHHRDAAPRGGYTRRVLLLGGLAFMLMLCEGVANDWSALQVKEHLASPDSVAALAFGVFSATMTIGRFTADRIGAVIGPVALVRYGALVAAIGMGTVVASPWLPLTLAGWGLFGAGLAGAVPQLFTAAGNMTTGSPGANMSRVVGMGYIGFLAGPACIGWLSETTSLTAAMVVPLACVLGAAALAPNVREGARAASVRGRP